MPGHYDAFSNHAGFCDWPLFIALTTQAAASWWKAGAALAGATLFRICFAGFCDPDAVIGELIVGARQLTFGHMTGDAIFGRDRAGLRAGGRVTSVAFRVVERRLALRLAVRIVTRHATDARIRGIIALAVCKYVRLKTDVVDIVRSIRGDLGPCPMALAAEIG